MEISHDENIDSDDLNLNYTYRDSDSFNNVNVNCNNKEQNRNLNQNFVSINEQYQNQTCVNCSKLLPAPAAYSSSTSTRINEDYSTHESLIFEIEIIEDLDLPLSPNAKFANTQNQRIQVKEILSSIYGLNFLHLLSRTAVNPLIDDPNDPVRINNVISGESDSGGFNQNMCLCSGCARVLTNLYKYYLQFNQLRTFDSILSKKIQQLDQIRSQAHQSHCESDPFEDTVVKCEVLTEEGADPIIFDDVDDHHGDRSLGVVQIELEEYDSDHCDGNDQETDVELLEPDSDRATRPEGPIIIHESASALLSADNRDRGPWVRLSRLRNVSVGSPVRASASKQHRNDNCVSPSHAIAIGKPKMQKIRKLINQADKCDPYLDLVSSGSSDNDNPNDSDFYIGSGTISTKQKRKLPIRSHRKSKTTKAMENLIKIPKMHPENSCNSDSDNTQGLEDSDSDSKLLVKKAVSKPKLKTMPQSKSKPKAVTTSKATPKIKNYIAAHFPKLKAQSESKSEPGTSTRSHDSSNPEENVETGTGKDTSNTLKRYRRRKARVPNPCWYCPLDFTTQEDCLAHTKATHFSAGQLICSRCSKLSLNKKSHSVHLTICEKLCPGMKLAPWLCALCGKRYPLKCDLDSHLLVHNQDESFACSSPDCTFKTKSQLLLNLHFDRMHVEKPKFKMGEDGQLNLSEPIIHKCDLCEATFKNDHGRKIHMHNLHDPEGFRKYREKSLAILARQRVETKLRNKDQSFVCPDCNIDFFSYLRLIGHQKTAHHARTEFVCEQCGKDFLREKSLKRHVQFAHTDERPFICEHCGKAFKTAHNLKDHVSHTHSEEGRRKYNDLMRRKNQRRKMVAEALAKKHSALQQSAPLWDLSTI